MRDLDHIVVELSEIVERLDALADRNAQPGLASRELDEFARRLEALRAELVMIDGTTGTS